MNLPLPALLRTLLSLITTTHPTTNTSNGNTTSSPNSNPLLPRQPQGFTDPNIISQPITFYETASELYISNGRTYTTTYIDLISATAAFPVTPSTTSSPSTTTNTNPSQFADYTDLPIVSEIITFYITATGLVASNDNVYESTYINLEHATVGIPIIESPTPSIADEAVTVFITTPTSGSLGPSNPTLTDGIREIVLTPNVPVTGFETTSTSGSLAPEESTLSSVTTSIAPTITTPSSTSPVLDLSACSTFTGAESALEGCISSVISVLSLPPGGPIIASITNSSTTSTTSSSNMREKSVTPTTTVTMPYLGAVVPKGKATFIVGGGGLVEESMGVRERGMLVGWVGVWGLLGVVGFLRR